MSKTENPEVAEPETADETDETNDEEVEEDQYDDEPPEEEPEESPSDSAFAEMRRRNQELENDNKLMFDALQRYFDGKDAKDLSVQARAYAEQRDPADVQHDFEQEQAYTSALQENEALKDQLTEIQAEKWAQEQLEIVKKIDPSVKDIFDLGESFMNLLVNGVNADDAYYAAKAKELKEKVVAPSSIGKVTNTKTESEFYTSEENSDSDSLS